LGGAGRAPAAQRLGRWRAAYDDVLLMPIDVRSSTCRICTSRMRMSRCATRAARASRGRGLRPGTQFWQHRRVPASPIAACRGRRATVAARMNAAAAEG
jgi:hypothetical protein